MKIFVTYSNTPNCIEYGNKLHDEFLKKPDVFTPILGGKELYKGNNTFLKSMQGDNVGNNVSVLNPYINEHTVIYWVGQHLDEIKDDYIGFCHYRRLFDVPDQNQVIPSTNNNNLDKNTIYVNKMSFSVSNGVYFLINHDPTVVRALSEFFQKIFRSNNNFFTNSFISFLNSNILYSANMFIMHRDRFKEYIKLITPIYNIIFSMIYPYPNVQDRSCSFILERVTSCIISMMQLQDDNIKIEQGKYVKLGDNIVT